VSGFNHSRSVRLSWPAEAGREGGSRTMSGVQQLANRLLDLL
jgi:hypothetical protein